MGSEIYPGIVLCWWDRQWIQASPATASGDIALFRAAGFSTLSVDNRRSFQLSCMDPSTVRVCDENSAASKGGRVFDRRPFSALKGHRVRRSEAIFSAVSREPAAPNRSVT
jgi:hypothetical protein